MTTPQPIPMHPEAIEFIEELVREHTRNHIGHAGGDSLPDLRFSFEFWDYFHGRGYSEDWFKSRFSVEGFESLLRLDNFHLYRDLINDICNRRRGQLEKLDLESEHRSDPYLPETGECLQGQLSFLRKFQDAVNSNPKEANS